MNIVALTGRITHDLEVKSSTAGNSVLRFCIAVDRNYQAKGQERVTDFVDCIAWRSTAEFIGRNFKKGQMIALTGEIQTSSYEKDGQKRKSVDVVANQAYFCGGKETPSAQPKATEFEEITDELPWG